MHLESTTEQHFCKRVEEAGGWHRKTMAIGRRGFFDRIAVLPGGRVIFVELKRPKGGVFSEHQKTHAQEVRERGGTALRFRSIEEIDLWFLFWLGDTE